MTTNLQSKELNNAAFLSVCLKTAKILSNNSNMFAEEGISDCPIEYADGKQAVIIYSFYDFVFHPSSKFHQKLIDTFKITSLCSL